MNPPFPSAQTKSAVQVGKPIGAGQESLLTGVTDAPECLFASEITPASKSPGDFIRLIEPAPSLSSPVERNRYENPWGITLGGDSWILPRLFRKESKLAMQVNLPAILVGMHDLGCLIPGAGSGQGKIKGKFQSSALGAENVFWDKAFKMFSALDAVRLLNSGKAIAALRAEVPSVMKSSPAQGAGRRIEEIEPASGRHSGRAIHNQQRAPGTIREKNDTRPGRTGMPSVGWSAPGEVSPVDRRSAATWKNPDKEDDQESGKCQGGEGDQAFLDIASYEVVQVFIQFRSAEGDPLEEDVCEDPSAV